MAGPAAKALKWGGIGEPPAERDAIRPRRIATRLAGAHPDRYSFRIPLDGFTVEPA